MGFGLLYVALGAGLLTASILNGGPAWVLAWPALAFFVVAAGYLGVGARVLGKRPDGTIAPAAFVLLLPYFMVAWLYYRLLRRLPLSRPWDEVIPGMYVGRRCYPDELPRDIGMIVDLTAELPAPRGLPPSVRYVCLPTLDGHVPEQGPFRSLVAEIAGFDEPVLVHCAAGHGRAPTTAAAVLLQRGRARTYKEAIQILRRTRPRVLLGRSQRRLVRTFVANLSTGPSQVET